MSSLVVGGVPIKVAVSSPRWTRSDAVDRARAFDNTFRSSQTGGAVRTWDFETPPVLASTEGETYKAALSTIASQLCSGDIIALPTMCSAELGNGTPVRVGGATYVTLSFSLHEIQPAKMLLRYAPGDTITGETFTRASAAREIISTGVVTSRATNVKRETHYIGGVRSTLLEWLSINLCLQSENFGVTWVAAGTPTRVAAAHSASGVVLDLIGDDNAGALEGYSQVITFTGNGLKASSVHVKAGTSTSFAVRQRDNTAAIDRFRASFGWSGGLPVLIQTDAGSFLGYETLADGVFRLWCQSTGVVAANANTIHCYPATTAGMGLGNTGDTYMGGVQVEDVPFPTSYNPTTTGAVTRNASVYSLPWTTPPVESTFYMKFVEKGTLSTGTTTGLFAIGSATSLFIYNLSGFYSIVHRLPGSTDRTSTLAAAPAIGQVVELRGVLFGDGSVQIGQSIAGAAETVGAQSIAAVLNSAWDNSVLLLNDRGTGPGVVAIQSLKIVAGARSLAEMRAL